MKFSPGLPVLVLLLPVAAGCATKGEQRARAQWEDLAPTNTVVRSARPEVPADATLADYLKYAALNNPQLEAAFNKWKAALERIPQARTLPDPRFTFGYFIENVETRVGPQEYRAGLSQMFPWFGKLRLHGEMAMADADAAQQEYEAAKLNLFYQVKNAYYEYYYLGRAIAITDENLQLLKHLESVARAQYEAGAPLSGVIKAQVELGKLDDQLRSLRDLAGPIEARLNAALNRPPTATLLRPHAITTDTTMLASDDEVLRWLADANPELKSLTAQIAKSEKAIALARKEYFPDITLGVDYIETGGARMPGVSDSGKDPIMAMVSINLPIWHDKYRSGVAEARAQREAATDLRANRENTLLADLKLALYKCRDAERKIKLYGGTLIPQAEQSVKVSQQAYEAGKVSFLDLIDAQRLLLQFQLDRERALANHQQRLAEIEMLVGRSIPTRSTGKEKSE